MATDWAKVNDLEAASNSELVKIHQHVVTRLKVISESSRALIQQTYTDAAFSGSLFIAFVLLLPIQILSYFTEPLPRSLLFQLMLTALTYVAAVVWGFLFRRRLRTFFNQIVTIGLHYYDIETMKQNSGNRADQSGSDAAQPIAQQTETASPGPQVGLT